MRILNAPKVYLIARPQIVEEGMSAFLADQKLQWPTPVEGVRDADRLVEAAGRCCYMSFGKKAGSKTNSRYIQNLLGINDDGSWKSGPAHGSVCEHPCWSFLIVGAGRGFCYDDQTEVLTQEGWKYWPDIRGDESFATLNLEHDLLEYQLATDIIREPYKGQMIRVKSKMVDLLVTPNHRMLYSTVDSSLWRVAAVNEIASRRFKVKRNVANWQGEEVSLFCPPDYIAQQTVSNQHGTYGVKSIVCAGRGMPAKAFARFLGYWLAEGHLDHSPGSGYSTVISQNDDSPCYQDILNTIISLGLPYHIKNGGRKNCKQIHVAGGRSLYEYLKPYSGSSNKAIPSEIKGWSSDLLTEIIDAHLAGDGSFPRRGSGEGHTTSKRLADDLQEIALKTGISATVRRVDRRDEPARALDGYAICHLKLGYVVSYCRKRNEPLLNHNGKQSCSDVFYDGQVYCVTVPNGLLYVRRNGRPVWCGNSHEQVRHRTGWAYSQLSTRYCDFEREEEEGTWEPGFCVPPLGQLDPATATAFEEKIRQSQQAYCELLKLVEKDLLQTPKFIETLAKYDDREKKRVLRKAARGAARDILPIATEAIMVMSANARAIWNCIVLRGSEHAEAVIRSIYVQITKIMEVEMPSLFRGIKYETCWDGSDVVVMPRDKL